MKPIRCPEQSPARRAGHLSIARARIGRSLAFIFGVLLAGITSPASGNSFVSWQSLHPLHDSDAKWADFDGDGDLDLALCGTDSTVLWCSRCMTYENQGGTMVFRELLRGVDGTGSDALAWGDYDGDGDLDLVAAGRAPAMIGSENITWIHENDGAGHLYYDASQNLLGVNHASLAWGDYDNDGDLDLVVIGQDGTTATATLYRNHPLGTLTAVPGVPLTGLYSGSADWADWDGDGDLDLVTTGYDGAQRRTIFYENDPVGTLNNVGSKGLPGVYLSDIAWGDYDNDGDLDLAFTGEESATARHADIYRNDGDGSFSQVAHLLDIYRSSCAWGDYDNDGDLDVTFCGTLGAANLTRIYENTGTGFDRTFMLTGCREGALTWADVDRDGDLDFLVMGMVVSDGYTNLFENVDGLANTPPSAPDSLEGFYLAPVPGYGIGSRLTLRWWGASDDTTSEDGLYYCLRVGTSPGDDDVVSGTYGTPLLGNVGQWRSMVILLDSRPVGSSLYWSVRSIDSGLEASDWSPEQVCELKEVHVTTVRPIDDAFVDWFDPATAYGDSIPEQLIVGAFNDSTDIARSLLRFPLALPWDADVVVAELSVYCNDVFSDQSYYVDAWGVDGVNWEEETINWFEADTSITYDGNRSDRRRAIPKHTNTWRVTGPVRERFLDGLITLALRSGRPAEGEAGQVEYLSKDQGFGPTPRLRIFWVSLYGVGVDDVAAPAAAVTRLEPNAPNPFRPSTTIRYQLARAGPVSLVVYDVSGRRVCRLVDRHESAGWHAIDWRGRDDSGRRVASGVYFYRLVAPGCDETRKMILTR